MDRLALVFAACFALDRLAASRDVGTAVSAGAWWGLLVAVVVALVRSIGREARLARQLEIDRRAREAAREIARARLEQDPRGVTFPASSPGARIHQAHDEAENPVRPAR